MFEEYKRTIIISVIDVIIILLIALLALADINIGPIHLSSIKSIMAQDKKVKAAEAELDTAKTLYEAAVTGLESQKAKFEKEKGQYDAISDDTVNIIKEATAKENYSIEYMWIKLGNYAIKNNLSIVLVEPGGASDTSSATTIDSTESGETTSTPVSSSSQATTNQATTNQTTTNQTTTNQATTNQATDSTSQSSASDTVQSANKSDDATDTDTSDANGDKTLKINISGTYMNVSDFIFEVENDSELKFKLDNISMQPTGDGVSATFDVKNMIIVK